MAITIRSVKAVGGKVISTTEKAPKYQEKKWQKVMTEAGVKIEDEKKKKKSGLKKLAAKKLTHKPILKKQKITLTLKEIEQEPYTPIYFKEKVKEDTRQFYFK